MSRRIYKYCAMIELNDNLAFYDIRVPVGAQILHVGQQGMKMCVWAIVDPDAPLDEPLVILPTGAEVPDGLEHISTFQLERFFVGTVWHVFRRSTK